MEAIVELWGRQVERLGQSFARAEARVDPKSAETCRHCALPGLCRVTDAHRMRGNGQDAGAAS
jgi:hypothetical protein